MLSLSLSEGSDADQSPFFHSHVSDKEPGRRRFLIDGLLAVISGLLLMLGFPEHHLSMLIWVALAPLFVIIRRSGLLRSFAYSFLAGLIFNCGFQWWTLGIDSIKAINFVLAMPSLAFYMGLFGLAAGFFNRKCPQWNALTFPSVWILVEYIRSHAGFISWPWGILGYSQYNVPSVLSIAAYTGVYGLSFLIVTVNTVLAEVASSSLVRRDSILKHETPFAESMRVSLTIAVVAVTVLLLSLATGLSHSEEGRTVDRSVKVGLVQGNMFWGSERKDDAAFLESIVRKYTDLTMNLIDRKPDLILWPSASVPGVIPYDVNQVRMLSSLAKSTESFMLVGSSGFDKFNSAQRSSKRVSTSAFLFSPQGHITGKYDKIRLLPFDEYLPLRGVVRWPSWMASERTDYFPGSEMTVFSMAGRKFGVLICWEYMFPEQFRTMVLKGVDFMVNMTNEGFIKSPAAHHQMLAMSVMRAAENGIPIARITSTGVSAVIGPDGRVRERVRDGQGRDTEVEGVLVTDISLPQGRSFYSRHGDVFLFAVFGFLFLLTFKMVIQGFIQLRQPKLNS